MSEAEYYNNKLQSECDKQNAQPQGCIRCGSFEHKNIGGNIWRCKDCHCQFGKWDYNPIFQFVNDSHKKSSRPDELTVVVIIVVVLFILMIFTVSMYKEYGHGIKKTVEQGSE